MCASILMAINLVLKRKKMHILMILQIAVTVLLLILLLGRIQFVRATSKIAGTFSGENAFHFMPYQYIDDGFDLTKTIESKGIQSFEIGEIGNLAFYDDNNEIITAYGYNDTIIQSCNFTLSNGSWFSNAQTKHIPSIAVGSGYSIGDVFNVQEYLEGNVYTLEIVGTIEADEYIVTFEESANQGKATAEYFIANPECSLILPYDSDIYNCVEKAKQTEYIVMEASLASIVVLENSSDMEDLEKVLQQYGHATSIDKMLTNYEASIQNELFIYVIICVVFSILTIVGVGGNNGIQNILNQYDFVVYYILGATRKMCLLIEAFRAVIVIILGYCLALIIYFAFPGLFPEDSFCISLQVWLAAFLYLLFIFAITSGIFLYRLGKRNLITAYKESLKGKV